MKLKSEDLLNLIDTGLVRNIAEFLRERILDYDKNFEILDINQKKEQRQMISHYNEAVEIYNSCSATKLEKLKFPKLK